MSSPVAISMGTPQAAELQNAIQNLLVSRAYATEDDAVLAEYVCVMVANQKQPDQITAELNDLVGSEYDSAVTDQIFEEARRITAPAPPPSAPAAERDAPPHRAPSGPRGARLLGSALSAAQNPSAPKRPAPAAFPSSPPSAQRQRLSGVPTGPRSMGGPALVGAAAPSGGAVPSSDALAAGSSLLDRLGPQIGGPGGGQPVGFGGADGVPVGVDVQRTLNELLHRAIGPDPQMARQYAMMSHQEQQAFQQHLLQNHFLQMNMAAAQAQFFQQFGMNPMIPGVPFMGTQPGLVPGVGVPGAAGAEGGAGFRPKRPRPPGPAKFANKSATFNAASSSTSSAAPSSSALSALDRPLTDDTHRHKIWKRDPAAPASEPTITPAVSATGRPQLAALDRPLGDGPAPPRPGAGRGGGRGRGGSFANRAFVAGGRTERVLPGGGGAKTEDGEGQGGGNGQGQGTTLEVKKKEMVDVSA